MTYWGAGCCYGDAVRDSKPFIAAWLASSFRRLYTAVGKRYGHCCPRPPVGRMDG
jgi:hypothetical protein